MLMIFLMAIWSLDLIPYSIQDTINTTRRLPPRNYRNDGTGTQYRRSGRRFNATILSTLPTTTVSADVDVDTTLNFTTDLIVSSTTTSSPSTTIKPALSSDRIKSRSDSRYATTRKNKNIVNKTKIVVPSRRKSKTWTRGNNTKYITKSERDLVPKSNMQVLQFYAQPLNPIELNAQPLPTFNGGDTGNTVLMKPVVNPLTALSHSQMYMAPSPYGNTMPPINSLPYKTLPEEFVSSGESVPKTIAFKPLSYHQPVGLERPAIHSLPVLEPFHVYKRKPIAQVQPQKFVATIRPVSSPSVPILPPPVSVTRVYKYTEDRGPAFRLPFLDSEDSIDENLPILSAALDDRLNDRLASMRVRNYMTPPKLSQPLVYGTAAVPEPYRNDFQVINRYNNDLRTQTPKYYEKDEDSEGDNKENYSEEEVKKALKYIQRLKKSKPGLDRGPITFKNSNGKRRPNDSNEKENSAVDFDDDLDPEQISSGSGKKKRRKEKKDPFHMSDDDDDDELEDATFQVKSFSEEPDRKQEESRTKTIKTDVEKIPRSIETRPAPRVKEEIDEQEPFDNEDLGIENDGDDRVEFQMHGLGGADSYKFGYDTGKGDNRQFRYEERDANGKVKGHFGYYDSNGKLQLFNYEADPEHGYHLEKAPDH